MSGPPVRVHGPGAGGEPLPPAAEDAPAPTRLIGACHERAGFAHRPRGWTRVEAGPPASWPRP